MRNWHGRFSHSIHRRLQVQESDQDQDQSLNLDQDTDLYLYIDLDQDLDQDTNLDLHPDIGSADFRIRFMDCSKTQTQIKT